MERQCPPVHCIERCETWHARSVQTLLDDLIQPEDAAFTSTIHIGECDGRWIQLGGRGPLAVSACAVAARAQLLIQRGASGWIRSCARSHRNRIGSNEAASKIARSASHFGAIR